MPGLLALLAHPDDEFFCAGLLAAVAARGTPVHLAYWTRGEGGSSPTRRLIWSVLPRAWHFRVAEARRAGKILGAASVSFLDAVDPVPVGSQAFAPEEDLAVTIQKIESLCADIQPALILTHGVDGEYGHPAHRRLHEAARQISGPAPLVTFAATLPGAASPPRFWNKSESADYVFDSRPFLRQKIGILRAHRSQRGAFESLASRDHPSLRGTLRVFRFEGYHIATAEEPARSGAVTLLQEWAGKSVVV